MTTHPPVLVPLPRRREPEPGTWLLEDVLAIKGATRISVCIPARNEAATIRQVVRPIARELVGGGLVDELIVLDHDSSDATAREAERAGAAVVSASSVLSDHGPALGKGDVLWRSLAASSGDVVVWIDADLESFETSYVTRLVAPLLLDDELVLVRATYARLLGGVPGEGGRVTELVARPLLSALFPHLDHVRQPLGGEYAVRREAAESVPFEIDYGVELGLLIDLAERYGVAAIAQVDLGAREHRHQPLAALGAQARQVLRAALARTSLGTTLVDLQPPRPPLAELLGVRDLDEERAG
jgi:glucosyl-3-phosphoglycerate synthase